MPARRRSRDHSGGPLRRGSAQEGGQSAAARAATGFLLGLAAGGVAALVTPRREQRTSRADGERETVPVVT